MTEQFDPPLPSTDLRPVPKVAAVGVAGAVATALIGLWALFGGELNPDLAALLAGGLVWLAGTAAGYFKRG